MPVGYHPLTPAERCQIHALLHRGWSKREIAHDLGRDPATISRETSRNRGQRGDRQPSEGMVGKEWIYPQVRADRQAGGTLYRCLRRRGKKPNARGGRPAGRGHIPDRVDLAERPSVVDRGSKFLFLKWVEGQIAAAALTRRMRPARDRVHTCTADHGKEFARHREIAQKLGASFYFATPYPSWERGRNEHTNGLVHPYFPKGTDFRQVTPAQVQAVEDRLHRRPRKVLGYHTPAAVFARIGWLPRDAAHGPPSTPALRTFR